MRGCSRGGMHGRSRGACVVAAGGHAWLLWGGMCGCSGGAFMVALGGGHAWLLWGGMCVCSGGHAWLLLGGCAWLLRGGMHGCSQGGMRGFFNEIRSMSGRYASYWNAFFLHFVVCWSDKSSFFCYFEEQNMFENSIFCYNLTF